jgi:hypothetical protein
MGMYTISLYNVKSVFKKPAPCRAFTPPFSAYDPQALKLLDWESGLSKIQQYGQSNNQHMPALSGDIVRALLREPQLRGVSQRNRRPFPPKKRSVPVP